MNVVTVSRLIGSFGDVIAALIARKLGFELIGREQIQESAAKSDPEYASACRAYESECGQGILERVFLDQPSYASLFEAFTFQWAGRGNVVIVGRGSQIILREIPGVFRVRVVAPLEARVGRIMERYDYSQEEAKKFIEKYDHERENVVRSVFHRDPNDLALYDMMINTAHFTSGAAAEVIVEALDRMEGAPQEESVKQTLNKHATAKLVETFVRKRLAVAAARNVEIIIDSEGAIRITGRVSTPAEKDRIGSLVLEYPGVTEAANELNVVGFSFGL